MARTSKSTSPQRKGPSQKASPRKGAAPKASTPKGPPRKVLVTGGAGFIGSNVADGYLARGDRVWIVDDLSSGKRENIPAGAEFVHMSIEDPKLHDLCRDVRFDLVNHHAAQIDVRISVADPKRDARTNVIGLLNVIEAARANGAKRMIYVSSGGVVYGEPDVRPTPETAPKLPLSPYGVTKLTGEYYLHYTLAVHGMEYVALRYSNVFGPRQDPHGEAGVVAIFCTRLLRGERELLVYGDGKQTRDYVFVGDVVAANMVVSDVALPAAKGLDSRAFNVATGKETSVNKLADVIEKVSGRKIGRKLMEARKGELRNSCLDTKRLRKHGWKPSVTLEEGLRRTYEWIAGKTKAV